MYLIGIDIGTSGTKTVLFDGAGKTIASCTAEYPMFQPQNGWAEQNPEDWWNAVWETLRAVTAKVDRREIVGVGLSGQMHGLVMLDAEGKVIRDAILWCDGRTGKECEEITRLVGRKRLIEITANPALAGFTASKILWVRNHEPDNYEKCRHILLPKDYIRYRLTGEFATEVSDASGMQLLDIANRCWSAEILQKLDISADLLAKVYESPEITGKITRDAARETGLAEGTIVVGGAGDNAAAAVGTGVVTDKKAFTTIGTSGVVYAHMANMATDLQGRVHTFCCAVPGEWHVMGVTQAAGLSLKWFRDNFCGSEKETASLMRIDPYVLMDEIAGAVPVGCNRLLYLPYLMGERTPHLDPDARGAFVGLSAIHGKAEMLRAVMEGVVYSLRDCLDVLREMRVDVTDMAACGGGGTSRLWRQMLADNYGCRVKTVSSREGPALGAAILAGVGAGVYASVQEGCSQVIRTERTQEPEEKNRKAYEAMYEVYRWLYPALKAPFHKLAELDL